MSREDYEGIERNACPTVGACGGMYTANTMSSSFEALGISLLGSSQLASPDPEKADSAAESAKVLVEAIRRDIKPRDIITRSAIENAITLAIVLGGSTNVVLHLLAIAHAYGIELSLEDFQNVSDRTPFLADIKPSGKYVMEDVYRIGGIPKILHFLLKQNMIDGNNMTVTGRTLGENLDRWVHKHGELDFTSQDVIHPLNKPIKETGHLRSVEI